MPGSVARSYEASQVLDIPIDQGSLNRAVIQ